MRKRVFGFLTLFPSLLLSQPSGAGPLCPSPASSAPSLAFTITSFRPGDLDRTCAQRVDAARRAGFTTATLVPAIMAVEDPTRPGPLPGLSAMRTVGADRTLNPGELERCLEITRAAGMDIVFQPHLEGIPTLTGRGEGVWRAGFDIRPNDSFYETVFGEFNRWLREHASELAASRTQVDIVPAAELERSTATYPSEWSALVRRMRADIPEPLRTRARIGMNPNWNPHATNQIPTEENCDAYREMVRSFDFVAPSLYGNWQPVLDAEDGLTGVRGRWDDVTRRLSREHRDGSSSARCRVPEFRTARMTVGEFGVGGNTRAIEADVPLSPPTIPQRREMIRRLLDWGSRAPEAASEAGAPPLPMSFWTLATFDPVGIAKSTGTVPDLAVVHMLRDYTRARCPGIDLPDLLREPLRDPWGDSCPSSSPGTGIGPERLLGTGDSAVLPEIVTEVR
jgi:hypothetical protein